MGTHGFYGVWHEERQRYYTREVTSGGGVSSLGPWLLREAPDRATAMAAVGNPPHEYVNAPRWTKYVDFGFRDGRWWSDFPEELPIPLRLHLAFKDKATHAAMVPLLAEVDEAMGGAPPAEAPPKADVETALSVLHDENERLRGLLWKSREVLWRCDGVGSEAKTQHEAITKALEGER